MDGRQRPRREGRLGRGRSSDVQDYLVALAEVNHHGFGFLSAFGLTWLVAGVVWLRVGERAGAYAALFQAW